MSLTQALKPRKERYSGRKITWDHVHKIEDIFPYEFESAGDLLMDFWAAVDEALK